MDTKSVRQTLALFTALVVVPCLVMGQLFTKVTQSPVTTTPSGSRSCNFLDFDNDDFQDLLITNGKQGGEDNFLYHNAGDGTFTLMLDPVCNDGKPSDGATCADFNNDGFIDIYIANWYGVNNLLYQNLNGTGFVQIDTGIVANDLGYSETAAWGNADGDGLLDLYVANSEGTFRNYFYHNLGSGRFEKITTGPLATEQFASRCVSWIDIDLDGDQDLFVTNESNQRNNLYRNDGYPNFTKITTGSLVTTQFASHTASWADFDNDGDFDVVVGNYNQANQLFKNDGTGSFSLVNNPWGGDIGCTFSSSFADYDNDADLDLFITNGYCTSYSRNYLYQNNGNGTFTRNLSEPMAIDSGSSYGCAWGDYDNNGFMDLAVANWRNETQPNALYQNNGNGNHWFKLKLTGTVSNRSAIGAIVRCRAVVNGNPVWQMRELSAQSGYCSQNSLVVHFGLLDASVVDSLVVQWPSGIVQSFGAINANSYFALLENGSLTLVGNEKPVLQNISFKLAPNPNHGQFVVEIGGGQGMDYTLQVLDHHGRTVHSRAIHPEAESFRIPLHLDLADGMYHVRLQNPQGETLTRKLVVGK